MNTVDCLIYKGFYFVLTFPINKVFYRNDFIYFFQYIKSINTNNDFY